MRVDVHRIHVQDTIVTHMLVLQFVIGVTIMCVGMVSYNGVLCMYYVCHCGTMMYRNTHDRDTRRILTVGFLD